MKRESQTRWSRISARNKRDRGRNRVLIDRKRTHELATDSFRRKIWNSWDEACIHLGSVRDWRFWTEPANDWHATKACASDTRRVETAAMECCGMGANELNQETWTMVSHRIAKRTKWSGSAEKILSILWFFLIVWKETHLLCRYYRCESFRGQEFREVDDWRWPVLERQMLFQNNTSSSQVL